MPKSNCVLIRGGGDLASGVAIRLHRAGVRVIVTELPSPLAVRRKVSFAEAVYEGTCEVENVRAGLIDVAQFPAWNHADGLPVIIDPDADILSAFDFPVLVDGRLTKLPPSPLPVEVPLHIGLGPGFSAGDNCHAVIETRRSHTLGRVIWKGPPQPDSGEPEGDPRRVLRAPADGVVFGYKRIGDHVGQGDVIAAINREHQVVSPFAGVLRGLVRDGIRVTSGLKIGDVDSRNDRSACFLVSDKALAVGGGVLEAVFSKKEIREQVIG